MECIKVFLICFFFRSVWCQNITLLEPLQAVEGGSLSLWCIVSGGASGIVLRENDVSVDSATNGELNDTHREFIVSSVERTDNGRTFVCAVQEFTSNNATLTVFYVDSFVISPNADVINDTLTLTEGESSDISFSININPLTAPTLTRENGVAVNSDRVMLMEGMIRFSGVSRNDAGVYLLTATSQGSSPSVMVTTSERIVLAVEYGPSLTIQSMGARCVREDMQSVSCFVMLDSVVSISCDIDSVPEAVGSIVESGRLNVSNVEVEDTSITFNGVSEENLGRYECTASNVVDGQTLSASLNINVQEDEVTTQPTMENSSSAVVPAICMVFLTILYTLMLSLTDS